MSAFGADHPQTLKARLMVFKSCLNTDGVLPLASEVRSVVDAVRKHYGEDVDHYLSAKLWECQLIAQRGDLAVSREATLQLLDQIEKAGPIRKQVETRRVAAPLDGCYSSSVISKVR